MTSTKKAFKKGAASFYIVAFSTLILMIIATSFAAIIISEITRTTNDDLSQSAYDSAMAGVEDAKLAFYNYQNCMTQKQSGNAPSECDEIISIMNNPNCDMVGQILGRTGAGENSVIVQESNTGNVSNNMQQAYTCVEMKDSLDNYQSTLSSSNMIRVVKVKFDNGTKADDIKKVRVSWQLDADSTNINYSNFGSNGVVFPQRGVLKVANPPTISLAMLQTADTFKLSDFTMSQGERTDRGMVYLVPTDNKGSAASSRDGNYIGAYKTDKGANLIDKRAFWKSNDKTSKNLPYAVYCEEGNEYMCSATIDLPNPVLANKDNPGAAENKRSDDTFVFVVGLPYGEPTTDFMLEFFCADGVACGTQTAESGEETTTNQAKLKGVQVEIDSTGKANDLFRRVAVRLDNTNDLSLSLMGPLELLESGGKDALKKDYVVTTEYNFE